MLEPYCPLQFHAKTERQHYAAFSSIRIKFVESVHCLASGFDI